MSQFTPTLHYETEFDGDKITCEMRRLKRKHMLELISVLKSESSAAGETEAKLTSMSQLAEAASRILPECLVDKKLSGLKDKDGNALSLDQIIEEAYFAPLIVKLVMFLFANSSIAKGSEDEKKLGPASAG